jgi:hypothetical protein
MTTAKGRKRPKFRVGQMVVFYGPNSRSDYGRRVRRIWPDGRTYRYQVAGAHADNGWLQSQLRPLTRREAGTR